MNFSSGFNLKFTNIVVSAGGKSSVLTAVVVGLGGKATATNRGQSIKNFIKHGKKYHAFDNTGIRYCLAFSSLKFYNIAGFSFELKVL